MRKGLKTGCLPLLCAVCLLTGCGADGAGSAVRDTGSSNGVEDVLQKQIAQAEAVGQAQIVQADALEQADAAAGAAEAELTGTPAEGVDIDLTVMSSTMVYSEVYNMLYEPEGYIGKTVKMQGTFSSFYGEEYGKYYYSCLIADAAACCSQGIEFEPEGDAANLGETLEDGAEISVVGVFDTYMEGDYRYCTLRNATLEI